MRYNGFNKSFFDITHDMWVLGLGNMIGRGVVLGGTPSSKSTDLYNALAMACMTITRI